MSTIQLIADHLRHLWSAYVREERGALSAIEVDFYRSGGHVGPADGLMARIGSLEAVMTHFRPTDTLDHAILATVHADQTRLVELNQLNPPEDVDLWPPAGELARGAIALRDYILAQLGGIDLGLVGFASDPSSRRAADRSEADMLASLSAVLAHLREQRGIADEQHCDSLDRIGKVTGSERLVAEAQSREIAGLLSDLDAAIVLLDPPPGGGLGVLHRAGASSWPSDADIGQRY